MTPAVSDEILTPSKARAQDDRLSCKMRSPGFQKKPHNVVLLVPTFLSGSHLTYHGSLILINEIATSSNQKGLFSLQRRSSKKNQIPPTPFAKGGD